MKKILAVLCLSAVIAMTFAGCESNDDKSSLNSASGDNSAVADDYTGDVPLVIMYDDKVILEEGEIDSTAKQMLQAIGISEDMIEKAQQDTSSSSGDSSSDTSQDSDADETDDSDSDSTPITTGTETDSSGKTYSTKNITMLKLTDLKTQKDYTYDGEVMSITFKIKDDAEDGVYPIVFPDYIINSSSGSDVKVNVNTMANYDNESLLEAKYDGSITVGGSAKSDSAGGKACYVSASNVAGEPGDEVTVSVQIQNNPGLVGLHLVLQYNSDVLEVVSVSENQDFISAMKS